ncbi:MAG: patatin-like phospholipase family protein [candidate division Zixibacteria bacterium]|nr:patatin-like phospholipase family protein [candidate division Zixibacteria bacterium]
MKTALCVLSLLLCLHSPTLSNTVIRVGGLDGLDPQVNGKPLVTSLALSGGGARGISGIGLLKAFEDRDVQLHAIAGTSIGGIVGGLYACGYPADDISAIFRNLDISDLLSDEPRRSSMFASQRQERDRHLLTIRFDGFRPQIPQALTGGQKLTALMLHYTNGPNYLAGQDFTRLPIPFKTISTDIVSGEPVILSRGSLADALRATMAFPLAFTGVEQGDRLLMDGGMLMPVPVEIVREMTPTDIPVVAVNTTSPLLAKANISTPVDIANQVTSIMTAEKLVRQLDLADFVIEPVPTSYSSANFNNLDTLIALGYAAGQAMADSLAALRGRATTLPVYFPVSIDILADDSTLAAKLTRALPRRTFTLNQLTEDLKTVVRTESLYSLTATLQPTIGEVPPDFDADSLVNLTVEVRPSLPLSTTHIRFEGNRHFHDTTLLVLCTGDEETVSRSSLNSASERIADNYHAAGYDLAHVSDVQVDYEHREITFVIDEAIIQRVDVRDNERSKDWLIRSYVPLKAGKPFSTSRAARGIDNLYGTDLFDRVTLDLRPMDSGALVNIAVKERKYSQLRVGWHWDDEYQSEEFVELMDDNVGGVGMEYLVHAQYGNERRDIHTGLRFDRIFFTYFTAQLDVHYRELERNLFDEFGLTKGSRDENRWGFRVSLGQQLARLGSVTGSLEFEELETRDPGQESPRRLGLRTLSVSSLFETLDRTPFPHSGERHYLELTFAGKLIGGDIEYTRFFSSLETNRPLGDYVTYGLRMTIGLSRRGLPPSEKFYAGGMYSFAGFRTSELAGDKLLLINQELRLKLPLQLYLIGHWDNGDVYTTSDNIKLKNLQQGFGISIALDSPVGPFEFGYGNGDSPRERYYFNAGFTF